MMLYKKILLGIAVAVIAGILVHLVISDSAQTPEEISRKTADQEELAEKLKESGRTTVVTDKRKLPMRNHEVRTFQPSAVQAEKIQALVAKAQSVDDDESVNALFEAKELSGAEVVEFVQQILDLPTEMEVRKEAFQLVQGYSNPSVLPLIKRAFADEDNELRLMALEALENIGQKAPEEATEEKSQETVAEENSDSEEIEEEEIEEEEEERELNLSNLDRETILAILKQSFNDPDPEIRNQAMASLLHLSDREIQLAGLGIAQESTFVDVRSNVMHVTGTSANWDTIELALKGLADADESVREEAQQNINFYINKNFESADQARAWWDTYKHLYDDDLFLEDLENLDVVEQNL